MLKIEQMVEKGNLGSKGNQNRNLYSIELRTEELSFKGIFERVEIDETELQPNESGLYILISDR